MLRVTYTVRVETFRNEVSEHDCRTYNDAAALRDAFLAAGNTRRASIEHNTFTRR